VRDSFVLKISEKLDPADAAPLLCAGITSWSPLKHWAVSKGDKVGVIGLGGLGHMGIKFAVAMGCEVVMITTSPEKGADARRLGVSDVLVSNDREQMKAHRGSFDFLLNTVPVKHDLNPYLGLLARNGTMVIVGAIEPLEEMHGGLLLANRRSVAGSGIGGGGFMLIHHAARGETRVVDGRETAPAGARPDMFLDEDGAPLSHREAVQSGHSIGVPGAIAIGLGAMIGAGLFFVWAPAAASLLASARPVCSPPPMPCSWAAPSARRSRRRSTRSARLIACWPTPWSRPRAP
jgi:hypothetical protein